MDGGAEQVSAHLLRPNAACGRRSRFRDADAWAVFGISPFLRHHGRMSESPATPAGADQALLIPGPAGRIEAALDLPEADASPQPVLAIICHPLPTEGGSMHNKVVTMAARALRDWITWL